jgi:hypothetical protein
MGATVSGLSAAATAEFFMTECLVNAVSVYGGTFRDCKIAGDVTFLAGGATDTWHFINCTSGVAGSGTPVFDLGAGVTENAAALNFRNYSGGIEIKQMGVGNASDNMSVEGNGQLIVNANCTGGSISLRGNWKVTDNSGGAVTITRDDNSSTIATNLDATVSTRAKLPTQNAAFNNIQFLFVAASDGVTPVTGATGMSVQVSKDGASFVSGGGTGPAEIGNGIYQYDASAGDMNAGVSTFRFSATGGTPGAANDTFVTIVTGGGV